MSDSDISGFWRLDIDGRIDALVARGVLDAADASKLRAGEFLLKPDLAGRMIENVIGVFGLPLAVAPNFRIDGVDRLVPMVVEEPSIVAGLSGAAKLMRDGSGFVTSCKESLLIGQMQLVEINDPDAVVTRLRNYREELLRLANVVHPNLLARGGGVRDIECRKLRLADGSWNVVLHLLVDTCDAMGANLVNTICERLAARVEALTGTQVAMRILSNLADRSLVTARITVPLQALGEKDFAADFVRDGIVQATQFADADAHRAATHNKGIMNGIDAVAIATGNDWRAIEAGVHAWAARDGRYRSLTHWQVNADGDLAGEITLPLKVGTAGAAVQANPAIALGLRIAGVSSAAELAGVMASVGLAQNFAALRALVTHGIQKGHMSLHARAVAAGAAAPPELFDRVVRGLIDSGEVKDWKARELIDRYRSGSRARQAPAGAAAGVACGKVILLGEHAAVYDRHVLAVPLPDAVRAWVSEAVGDSSHVTIPAWGVDEPVDGRAPAQGAAAIVSLLLKELRLRGRHYHVLVEPRIPVAMGLGASAALAVAVIRGFDALLGLGLDNRAVDALAYECERLAHGTPSGIDNNLATYGEPVLYTRSSASRTKPVRLAETPPLVIAASGQRGVTRDMVAAVRERRERNPAMYDTIFNEIDELSVAGAVALRDRNYAALGSMMNVCQGFLNAIEVSTPELERMVHLAREHGAVGAKLTGSGGGGSIVALCPGAVEPVAAALKGAGYRIIRMSGDGPLAAAGNTKQD